MTDSPRIGFSCRRNKEGDMKEVFNKLSKYTAFSDDYMAEDASYFVWFKKVLKL